MRHSVSVSLHTEAEIKWPQFYRRHILIDILVWKSLQWGFNFTEIFPKVQVNSMPAMV